MGRSRRKWKSLGRKKASAQRQVSLESGIPRDFTLDGNPPDLNSFQDGRWSTGIPTPLSPWETHYDSSEHIPRGPITPILKPQPRQQEQRTPGWQNSGWWGPAVPAFYAACILLMGPAGFFVALVLNIAVIVAYEKDGSSRGGPQANASLIVTSPPSPARAATEPVEQTRGQLRTWALVAGLLLTGAAVLGHRSIYVCFGASACWLTCVHVAKSQMERRGSTKGLGYLLLKGSVELFFVLTIVLGVGATVSFRVSLLQADTTTLLTLRSWEDRISWCHTFLDGLNFSASRTIILLVLLCALRLVEVRSRLGEVSTVNRAWKAISFGMNWLRRASLVSLVAASFTFLATKSDGPAAKLEARIREMAENYSQLRGEVRKALQTETKKQLCQRAWEKAPLPLREAIEHETKIEAEKARLLYKWQLAERKYDLREPLPDAARNYARETDSLKAVQEPPTVKPHEDSLGSLWRNAGVVTASRLSTALSESKAVNDRAGEFAGPTNGVGGELGKKLVGFILSPDQLMKHVGPLKLIDDTYPLVGEFANVMNDAFNEFVYGKLRTWLDRIERSTLENPRATESEIDQAASQIIEETPVRWHDYDQAWQEHVGRETRKQEEAIARDWQQLEADALEGEKTEIRRLVMEVSHRDGELKNLGERTSNTKWIREAREREIVLQNVQNEVDQHPLESLRDSLGPFDEAQIAELVDSLQLNVYGNSGSLEAHRYNRGEMLSPQGDVLEKLRQLESEAEATIAIIVRNASPGEEPRIRSVLGPKEFESYRLKAGRAKERYPFLRFGDTTPNPHGQEAPTPHARPYSYSDENAHPYEAVPEHPAPE